LKLQHGSGVHTVLCSHLEGLLPAPTSRCYPETTDCRKIQALLTLSGHNSAAVLWECFYQFRNAVLVLLYRWWHIFWGEKVLTNLLRAKIGEALSAEKRIWVL